MIIKRAAALLGVLVIGSGMALTWGAAPSFAIGANAVDVVDASPVNESDALTTPLQFQLTRLAPYIECRISVHTVDGEADGTDYAGFAQDLVFPEDSSTLFVNVNIADDTIYETTEDLFLVANAPPELSGEPPACEIDDNSGTGWITDNDEPGVLDVSMQQDQDVCESALPYGKVKVRVNLSRALTDDEVLKFDLTVLNGSASEPGDFGPLDDIYAGGAYANGSSATQDLIDPRIWHFTLIGPASFHPYLKIPIIDEWAVELIENFHVLLNNVELTGPLPLTVGDVRSGVNILSDDVPGQEIYVNDPSVAEGNPSTNPDMPFVVSLKYPAVCDGLKFHFHTADGTAVDNGANDAVYGDQDYYADSGWLVIPAGASFINVPIEVISDLNIEDDETFSLIIDSPADAVGDKTGVGTILNDDFPDVDIDDVQVVEGTGGTTNLVFTASLAAPGWPPCKVHSAASATYTATDGPAQNATGGTFPPPAGNATTDYDSKVGTVTFAPNECSKTITIPVVTDSRPENNENLTVTLSNFQDLNPGDEDGRGTIWNDDDWLVTGIDLAVLEGTPPGQSNHIEYVTLTLNGAAPTIPTPPGPPGKLSLNWSLEDLPGGASAAQPDYIDANGTVTWDPGTTQVSVPVTIVVDEVIELDEALLVDLFGGTSLGAANCVGGCFRISLQGKDPVTVTIINDDFELPETGASHVPEMTVFGFGLAFAGLALVLGTRRRRPSIS